MSDLDPDDVQHLMAATVGANVATRCLIDNGETATLANYLEQLDDIRDLLLNAATLATQMRNDLVRPFVDWDAEMRARQSGQQALQDGRNRLRREES